MVISCQSEIILSVGVILLLMFTLVRSFHLRHCQQSRNLPTASGRNPKQRTQSYLKGKHLIYYITCSAVELHILCLCGQEQGPYVILFHHSQKESEQDLNSWKRTLKGLQPLHNGPCGWTTWLNRLLILEPLYIQSVKLRFDL